MTPGINRMKPTRNLWPLGIIAALVIFISGTVGLIVMAASHPVDLVNDNYYEQEIRYQTRIDSLDRAARAGATAAYDAAGKRIILSLPAGNTRANLTGGIQLYRPSAAGLDQKLPLALDAHGMQTIDASGLQPGLWRVRVAWTVEGQEYLLDRSITNGAIPAAGISGR